MYIHARFVLFSSVVEEENVAGIPELWEEINRNGTYQVGKAQ
ncbi:hypothetical protein [Gracilibacillus sp. JCM 18860]